MRLHSLSTPNLTVRNTDATLTVDTCVDEAYIDRMIQIDKGVPIRAIRRGRTKELGELLRRMDVGDSFLLTEHPMSDRSLAKAAAKQAGIKLTSRTVEGGIRVWRIE